MARKKQPKKRQTQEKRVRFQPPPGRTSPSNSPSGSPGEPPGSSPSVEIVEPRVVPTAQIRSTSVEVDLRPGENYGRRRERGDLVETIQHTFNPSETPGEDVQRTDSEFARAYHRVCQALNYTPLPFFTSAINNPNMGRVVITLERRGQAQRSSPPPRERSSRRLPTRRSPPEEGFKVRKSPGKAARRTKGALPYKRKPTRLRNGRILEDSPSPERAPQRPSPPPRQVVSPPSGQRTPRTRIYHLDRDGRKRFGNTQTDRTPASSAVTSDPDLDSPIVPSDENPFNATDAPGYPRRPGFHYDNLNLRRNPQHIPRPQPIVDQAIEQREAARRSGHLLHLEERPGHPKRLKNAESPTLNTRRVREQLGIAGQARPGPSPPRIHSPRQSPGPRPGQSPQPGTIPAGPPLAIGYAPRVRQEPEIEQSPPDEPEPPEQPLLPEEEGEEQLADPSGDPTDPPHIEGYDGDYTFEGEEGAQGRPRTSYSGSDTPEENRLPESPRRYLFMDELRQRHGPGWRRPRHPPPRGDEEEEEEERGQYQDHWLYSHADLGPSSSRQATRSSSSSGQSQYEPGSELELEIEQLRQRRRQRQQRQQPQPAPTPAPAPAPAPGPALTLSGQLGRAYEAAHAAPAPAPGRALTMSERRRRVYDAARARRLHRRGQEQQRIRRGGTRSINTAVAGPSRRSPRSPPRPRPSPAISPPRPRPPPQPPSFPPHQGRRRRPRDPLPELGAEVEEEAVRQEMAGLAPQQQQGQGQEQGQGSSFPSDMTEIISFPSEQGDEMDELLRQQREESRERKLQHEQELQRIANQGLRAGLPDGGGGGGEGWDDMEEQEVGGYRGEEEEEEEEEEAEPPEPFVLISSEGGGSRLDEGEGEGGEEGQAGGERVVDDPTDYLAHVDEDGLLAYQIGFAHDYRGGQLAERIMQMDPELFRELFMSHEIYAYLDTMSERGSEEPGEDEEGQSSEEDDDDGNDDGDGDDNGGGGGGDNDDGGNGNGAGRQAEEEEDDQRGEEPPPPDPEPDHPPSPSPPPRAPLLQQRTEQAQRYGTIHYDPSAPAGTINNPVYMDRNGRLRFGRSPTPPAPSRYQTATVARVDIPERQRMIDGYNVAGRGRLIPSDWPEEHREAEAERLRNVAAAILERAHYPVDESEMQLRPPPGEAELAVRRRARLVEDERRQREWRERGRVPGFRELADRARRRANAERVSPRSRFRSWQEAREYDRAAEREERELQGR